MSPTTLLGGNRRGGHRKLPTLLVFGTVALLAQLTSVSATSASHAPFAGTRVTGQAWGASGTATVAGAKVVDKIALQTLPCIPGGSGYNSVATANVPANSGSVLSLGVVENRGSSSATGVGAEAYESSSVANGNALGGLVTFDSATARAHTSLTHSGIDNHLNDADVAERSGATFVNLRVGGRAVEANPGPGTTINLNGVKVILNEVIPSANGVRVNAIHLIITNVDGISGDVVVAHAETSLTQAVGQLSGFAYLSHVRLRAGSEVDPLLRASSGRQNAIYLPCAGTNGVEKVSTAAGLNVPGVLTSATSRSTVQGSISQSAAFSRSTHTVEDLNLLNGLITANLLKSVAETRTVGGAVQSSGTFDLAGLQINGQTIDARNIGATINLPGIGYVRVGEKICNDDETDPTPCRGASYNEITVYALHVVVNTANDFLPVGAEVIVGAAHSDVNFPTFLS